MTFAEFIESSPGLTDYARSMYLMIDAEAARLGRALAARHTPRALRSNRDKYVKGYADEMADALETDIRLAAIPALRAWAAGLDGIGNTFINWYVTLLQAHIDYEVKCPHLIAVK